MAKRERVTVLSLCVRRLGVHRGALAAARVAQWAIVTDDLGHVATTVEYADYWALDERTGWRHRAAIRDALGDDWPQVVEAIVHAMGPKRAPRDVMRVELPTRLVAA